MTRSPGKKQWETDMRVTQGAQSTGKSAVPLKKELKLP